MPAPIKPWEPSNIPVEIQAELNRRKKNRSFNYVDTGTNGAWSSTTGDWEKYRGPMSPWVRLCSNGAGARSKYYDEFPFQVYDKQGFVLFGGKDFYNGYGFNNKTNNPSIIGYMPDGTPHIIENDINTSHYPIHVPPPEIERINVTIQKELFRRARVEWICFSKAQMEYMTPYFLVPGLTCILEWGWNLYNPDDCLLDLTDVTRLKALNDNPYPLYTDHILKSNGNYDVLCGRITNYEWSVEGNKFKCVTEITSQDRLYAGLVVDAKAEYAPIVETRKVDDKNNAINFKDEASIPFGDLAKFTKDIMKDLRSYTSETPVPDTLKDLKNYVVKHHNDNWREYMFGIYTGTNTNVVGDHKFTNEMWINLGLVIECINMHHEMLKTSNKNQIFRVDIDDVIISAHPNLISADASVLLIPNAEAPKYFNGDYGIDKDAPNNDRTVLNNATLVLSGPMYVNRVIASSKDEEDKTDKINYLADYRLRSLCLQTNNNVYRDDLDELINKQRLKLSAQDKAINRSNGPSKFAFPFKSNLSVGNGKYPARFSGYLKDLYINFAHFQKLVENSPDIKHYVKLIEKIMEDISDAAGGFWNFKLISGPGSLNEPLDKPATMKIVDEKFVNTINQNNSPFTFDYFDSDSLLLGLNFRPTISNAQAIRCIYAQTTGPSNGIVLTNGNNELLDPVFKDRLSLDDNVSPPIREKKESRLAEHKALMAPLQSLDVSKSPEMYQITTDNGKLIRRLALPKEASSVLKMLLDDGDEENNPKYTGIMPGIQAQFTIQGIGGLRTFMMFLVRNLPEPYSEKNIVFRIIDVQDSIESGKWTTVITAGVIPLRNNIKFRLGLSETS